LEYYNYTLKRLTPETVSEQNNTSGVNQEKLVENNQDQINADEPINSPANKTKLEKLVMEVNKDNTVDKAINRESFVFR
jgi:hypothetical protein